MYVNTNMSSQKALNFARVNDSKVSAAMEKLSSGLRINKAGDDAAGLAISTRMTTQVRGMEVATRNASDGKSLLQTAESAMGSQVNILQRMRELAVQADNGTNSLSDKDSIQSEIEQLKNEFQHISETTSFNGIKLLDGSQASVSFHISDQASDTISVDMFSTQLNATGTGTVGAITSELTNIQVTDSTDANSTFNGKAITYGENAVAATLAGTAQDAVQVIDDALDQLSSNRAAIGATTNRLDFTIDNLATATQNTTEARSRIQDADMAKEMSELTKQKILSSASLSMLGQANQQTQGVLQLLQG